MLHSIKRKLYFVVASYFAFWAKFILRRWSPRVILITGSSGKTTTMHLVEAELGDRAFYSHNANSVFGLAFQLLGLGTNVESKFDWLVRLFIAPTRIFRSPPNKQFYVVEADCDRPHEGTFTSKFVYPEVVMWVSVYNTHSANFESQLSSKQFDSLDKAIAYEFGNFAVAAKKLVLANGDQPLLTNELKRVDESVEVKTFSIKDVTKFSVKRSGVDFAIKGQNIHLGSLQPKSIGVSLQMLMALTDYIGLPFKNNFNKMSLPPGRSNILKGKKSTTLIDSTYNTGLGATKALIDLFIEYPNRDKWIVIGDLLELGALEESEHVSLAKYLAPLSFKGIVLLGSRNLRYSYPLLKQKATSPVVAYDSPKQVLDYLEQNLHGGEAVLFKGAQGLEGVIEQLLEDPKDADQLVRRSQYWVKRRRQWGLPS